jgi:hypothetical protein
LALRSPQLSALVQSVRHLVPGASVSYVLRKPAELAAEIPGARRRVRPHGVQVEDQVARFWFPAGKRVAIVSAVRRAPGFTPAERDLLETCGHTVAGMILGMDRMGMRTPTRLAARYAFEHLVVESTLRRGLTDPEAWAPAMVFGLLQELALEHYEGEPRRSGVVFAPDARRYLEETRSRSPYGFEPFAEPQPLSVSFYEQPLSYRYVNGRDAFYLVDGEGNVHGVLRSRRPGKFSLSERARHAHLGPLLRTEQAAVWASFVGPNEDVNVVLPAGEHLRWNRLRWRFLDPAHLRVPLSDLGLETRLIDSLTGALYRISDSRVGALILIPEDPRNRPPVAGSIDDSALGAALLATFRRRHIRTLENSDALVGTLTSDGLTTLSRSGRILDAGEIVDLSAGAAAIRESRVPGGGRTAAGRIASGYGLAIKVSQDGPITVFRDGEELITLPR